jgi:adenosylmethionine-8-amino-7-oxononanoate aminotransferase
MTETLMFKGLIPGEQRLIQKAFPKWEYGTVENNKKVIDFTLGLGCFMLGFKRHDIIDWVNDRLKQDVFESGESLLNQSNTHTLYDSVFELSDKLYQLTQGYKSIFCLSGSDANEGAIKLAAAYHSIKKNKRHRIIGFNNSYHGSTFLNYNVGRAFMDLALYNLKPYEQIQLLDRTFNIDSVDWSNVMCIMVETRSWCDMLKSYPVDFWDKIKQIQQDHDVLLLVDDIFIGGGKTGHWMGWQELNIQPDIFTQGKAITGGYFPLSNTLYSQKVDDVLPSNFIWDHGFTYSFHSAGILSSLKYIDILEKENVLSQLDHKKLQAEQIFHSLGYTIKEQLGLLYTVKKGDKKVFITVPLTADREYFNILEKQLDN